MNNDSCVHFLNTEFSPIVLRGMYMSQHRVKDAGEGSEFKELRLLEELIDTPQISQRKMADRLGVALGVANILTKNLIRKGYVKATQVGWRRWVYSLTPAGFSRKVQLTRQYVDRTLDHYRRIRSLLREELNVAPLEGDSRVAILGNSELGELVCLALSDLGVKDISVFDDQTSGDRLSNFLVQEEQHFTRSNFDTVIEARANDMEYLVVANMDDPDAIQGRFWEPRE